MVSSEMQAMMLQEEMRQKLSRQLGDATTSIAEIELEVSPDDPKVIEAWLVNRMTGRRMKIGEA